MGLFDGSSNLCSGMPPSCGWTRVLLIQEIPVGSYFTHNTGPLQEKKQGAERSKAPFHRALRPAHWAVATPARSHPSSWEKVS